MASNYNSRPRPAEVLVEGATCRAIRRRETYDDLLRQELDVEGAPDAWERVARAICGSRRG